MMCSRSVLGFTFCSVVVLAACAESKNTRCADALTEIGIDDPTIDGGPVGPAEVTLRGVLRRPDDITIYSLAIAGQSATDEGDNFRQFSVKIPQGIMVDRNGSEASLPVAVVSNCFSGLLDPLTVTSPAAPKGKSLELTRKPSARAYVPLSPITPLELVASADAESHVAADGLSVELSTTLGSLAPTMLVLRNDGALASGSTYVLPADREGEAIVTARSGKLEARVSVVFLGPPRLSLAAGQLYPGTPLDVRVILPSVGDVTAELAACDLTSAPDIAMTGPANGVIQIVPGANAIAGHAAHITCRDVFGQMVSATYAVAAP